MVAPDKEVIHWTVDVWVRWRWRPRKGPPGAWRTGRTPGSGSPNAIDTEKLWAPVLANRGPFFMRDSCNSGALFFTRGAIDGCFTAGSADKCREVGGAKAARMIGMEHAARAASGIGRQRARRSTRRPGRRPGAVFR